MNAINVTVDNNPPDHYSVEQAHRIAHILCQHDIVSRQEFKARFDSGADWRILRGIGKIRANILDWMMNISDEAWLDLTGIDAQR